MLDRLHASQGHMQQGLDDGNRCSEQGHTEGRVRNKDRAYESLDDKTKPETD